MGNFKPTFKNAQIVPRPAGGTKIVLRDDEDTLSLLANEYWIEQNFNSPHAIWFKHATEYQRPNISWSTFDHLLTRGLIKEHGTLHPIARFTITKRGEREYAKILKKQQKAEAAPVVDKTSVLMKISDAKDAAPKPVAAAPAVIEDKAIFEKELKDKVVATHFINRLPDGSTLLTIHTNDALMLAKAMTMLGLKSEGKTVAPKGGGTRDGSARPVLGEQACDYCHRKYAVKKLWAKKPFRRYCGDKQCTREYQKEWKVKRDLERAGEDTSGL